ncbi:serine protease [Rhizobium sp. AG855]|uniref:trypsin-like serine peptidase n=1 Tax=Rhizobium sp. AG855 TaxID=2183898 RepID=UPI000FF34892|nr:serine protease [Rhizobium sp. AG855]RKE83977.1 hypothetical protein DFO46_0737 [Rhizobium sp. AG855]
MRIKASYMCMLLIGLAYSTAMSQAATLTIENLKNSDTNILTEDQMSEAEPMPLPEITEDELKNMQRLFSEQNRNIPDLKALTANPNHLTVPGELEKIGEPRLEPPYWSAGRLVFRDGEGKTKRCSAQYIDSLNVILTAAHCVMSHKTGLWYTGFSFQRALADNKSPQIVGWRCVSIYDAYHKAGVNYAYDYAFILASADDKRPALEMTTGTPASDTLTAIGYPRDPDSGRSMYKVDGSWTNVTGGIVTMSDNPLTKGSSGGAWFTAFQAGGGAHKNRVVSVNSHRVKTQPTQMNGPLFTDDTLALKEHVRQARCLD